MPTVKEIKDELDALGIEYPRGAPKADLEALRWPAPKTLVEVLVSEDDPLDEDLVLREVDDGFIDPNAHPAFQAD